MTYQLNNSSANYIKFSKKELENFIKLAIDGDNNAFGELSKYVRDISYSYFKSKHRIGKIINEEDVEDLTNNVYLSFAEQYHKIENIEFWLRRVLFLNFINWYKKTRKQKTFELDENIYNSHKFEDPANKLDAQKIVEQLNTLSEEKQQIVKLRFWEGLKFSEIAEQLNKSDVAVRKMFYRTLEEIRKKIK